MICLSGRDGIDFILIVPLLPSHCDFFVFGCGVSFFGGFQHLPVDGFSTASSNFLAPAEGDLSNILGKNTLGYF